MLGNITMSLLESVVRINCVQDDTGVKSNVREKLSSMNNQESSFQSLTLFYLAV